MRVLVLGNINSKWVKEYIEYVLIPLGYSVDVLGNPATTKYNDFYMLHGITNKLEFKSSKALTPIPFIRVLSNAFRTVEGNQWGEYDYIINMFVNYRDLIICKKIKSHNSKIILYYSGSDLLRKNRFQLKLNRIIISKPNAIVVGSSMLSDAMKLKYPSDTNYEIIRFGISAFENIDDYKSKHPLNHNTNCFCIGYNGICEQNHLSVIEVFNQLPKNIKEKVTLIVPMTYGATADYINEVRLKLEETGIKYNLLTEYMDNDAMAEMWCGISYFINAQTTDSLSASVLESLYAGAILINASWLEYPEYKEFGIKHLSFENYKVLYDVLTDILGQERDYTGLVASEKLKKHMSWQAAKKNWSEIFERLIQE